MSRRRATRWMMLCVLLAAVGQGQAADETGKWYVDLQVGYLWADKDRRVDDHSYYALGVGNHVSREWSVEANAVGGTYEPTEGSGSVKVRAVSIDALRVFRRAERISPFVIMGTGYIDDEFVGDGSHGNWLGQLGVGLLIDLFESSAHTFVLQLRPEAKARWDFTHRENGSGLLDYMGGVGIQLAFGAPPAHTAKAPENR